MAVFGPRRRTLVIPMATIDRVAELLSTKGRIARGYLGLGLQPVKLDGGEIGAMAISVDAGGTWRRGGRPAGRHHRRVERRADPRRPPPRARARTRQRRRQRQAHAAARGRAGRGDADDRRTAGEPMSGEPPALMISIEIGEPELADRLAALLADVPGLRLAAPGEPADATLVTGGEPTPDVALDAARTRRPCADRRRGVEQGDRPAARDLGAHGQIPHCVTCLINSMPRIAPRRWRRGRGSGLFGSRPGRCRRPNRPQIQQNPAKPGPGHAKECKKRGLDFLAFSRPNRAFSMVYDNLKAVFRFPLAASSPRRNPGSTSCRPRGLSFTAANWQSTQFSGSQKGNVEKSRRPRKSNGLCSRRRSHPQSGQGEFP